MKDLAMNLQQTVSLGSARNGNPLPFMGIRKLGAFSIVELLIVLSIIAMLGALLFPTMSILLEKRDVTACASNIRQIISAALIYAADSNNRLPVIEPDPLSDNHVYPPQAEAKGLLETLSPYGVNESLLVCRADLKGPSNNTTRGSSYEWIPLFDNEPINNLRLLVDNTVIVVPPNRAAIVSDWENVHSGKRNVGYVDGHVELR